MILQTKRLKHLLKKYNIMDQYGKLHVRVKRHYRKGGDYEWGNAIAHVRELTKDEIQKLIEEDKYLSIFVFRGERYGYSIIESGGSKIRETSEEEIDKQIKE